MFEIQTLSSNGIAYIVLYKTNFLLYITPSRLAINISWISANWDYNSAEIRTEGTCQKTKLVQISAIHCIFNQNWAIFDQNWVILIKMFGF